MTVSVGTGWVGHTPRPAWHLAARAAITSALHGQTDAGQLRALSTRVSAERRVRPRVMLEWPLGRRGVTEARPGRR